MAKGSTYADRLRSLLPTPLAGLWGQRWAGAIGAELDALLVLAKRAAKAGFVGLGPADAMPLHGRDRVIPALPGESMEAYRARLVGAWETWSWATTRYGVTHAVGLLGEGTPILLTVRDYIIPGWPARQWAVLRLLYTGRASFGRRWGTFAWGARIVDPIETMTDAEIRAQLRPLLRQWISARDRVRDVIIARDAPLWGRVRWGAFTWGSPGPSRRLGPAPWGTTRWGGAFTWGGLA